MGSTDLQINSSYNVDQVLFDKLGELLRPGNKVRVFYEEDNPNNCIYHIRAVVDGEYLVAREWGKYRRRWYYKVEHFYMFYLLLRDGYLTYAGKSNK